MFHPYRISHFTRKLVTLLLSLLASDVDALLQDCKFYFSHSRAGGNPDTVPAPDKTIRRQAPAVIYKSSGLSGQARQ
jgi:hypothetical protein